jgi:tetrahydromethanopterin S-methyltransferase F subunit
MFPGRENASYNAGIVTNAFYGAVIGFIIAFLLLVVPVVMKAVTKLGGRI